QGPAENTAATAVLPLAPTHLTALTIDHKVATRTQGRSKISLLGSTCRHGQDRNSRSYPATGANDDCDYLLESTLDQCELRRNGNDGHGHQPVSQNRPACRQDAHEADTYHPRDCATPVALAKHHNEQHRQRGAP